MTTYRDKWWYSSTVIVCLSFLGFLVVPGILAIILLIIQSKKRSEFYNHLKEDELLNIPVREKDEKIANLNKELEHTTRELEEKSSILENKNELINKIIEETKNDTLTEKEEIISNAKKEADSINNSANEDLKIVLEKTQEQQNKLESMNNEYEMLLKEIKKYRTQARKYKSEVVGLKNFNERFPFTINFEEVENQIEQLEEELSDDSLIGTVMTLHLHSDNSKELRKLSTATNKEIKKVLSKFEDRYSTKSNKTIYNLMIIALQAEIQILLFQLKYNNLEDSK
ncbi:hypothetical protein [Virgibacillus senegalensis]|uniref:hypothetical protein n=1 Tax=Virgibacillus senegalensis TaxID=1499679 RepID=UPI00069D3970|nr:hypothetical protein [Virgibacillus senegalensis]